MGKYKRALLLNHHPHPPQKKVTYNCGSGKKRNLELVQDWPLLGQCRITDTKWSRNRTKPKRQREKNPKLQRVGREQARSHYGNL